MVGGTLAHHCTWFFCWQVVCQYTRKQSWMIASLGQYSLIFLVFSGTALYSNTVNTSVENEDSWGYFWHWHYKLFFLLSIAKIIVLPTGKIADFGPAT